jgi:catechol 2,3-dioxygenase-like lactoylglutathione lyase family enzyme
VSDTFHLSLGVPDLDRATAFYEQLFGQAPAKRKPGYAMLRPRCRRTTRQLRLGSP